MLIIDFITISIRVPMIFVLSLIGQSVMIATNFGLDAFANTSIGSVNHNPHPLIPCKSGPVPND